MKMVDLQAAGDSAGGRRSPHLVHVTPFKLVVETLKGLASGGRWLDVGAGHGDFTFIPLDAGMRVVATEMSPISIRSLEKRFAGDANLEVRAASDSDLV